MRVPVFVISPVVINKLIRFKAVPQFLPVFDCVVKCRPKGMQDTPRTIGLIHCKYVLLHLKVVSLIFMFVSSRPKGHKGPFV